MSFPYSPGFRARRMRVSPFYLPVILFFMNERKSEAMSLLPHLPKPLRLKRRRNQTV